MFLLSIFSLTLIDAFVPHTSPLDRPTIKLPSPTFTAPLETIDLCLG